MISFFGPESVTLNVLPKATISMDSESRSAKSANKKGKFVNVARPLKFKYDETSVTNCFQSDVSKLATLCNHKINTYIVD